VVPLFSPRLWNHQSGGTSAVYLRDFCCPQTGWYLITALLSEYQKDLMVIAQRLQFFSFSSVFVT
jgi:hypothetical protein